MKTTKSILSLILCFSTLSMSMTASAQNDTSDVNARLEKAAEMCAPSRFKQGLRYTLFALESAMMAGGVYLIIRGVKAPSGPSQEDLLSVSGSITTSGALVAADLTYKFLSDGNMDELRSLLTEVYSGNDGIYMNSILQACNQIKSVKVDCATTVAQVKQQLMSDQPCESVETFEERLKAIQNQK